jgi:hypothetical protein
MMASMLLAGIASRYYDPPALAAECGGAPIFSVNLKSVAEIA